MTDDPTGGVTIARAMEVDVPGIVALMAANQRGRGGTLAAMLTPAQIGASMADGVVLVAHDAAGKVTGFLFASERDAQQGIPVIAAMFRAYPGAADAYVSGPICVAVAMRGRGLAQRLHAALEAARPGREGVLFINADNGASLRAHARMGAREVAQFAHGGDDFIVLSHGG